MAEWPVGGFAVAHPYDGGAMTYGAYLMVGVMFSIEQGQPAEEDVRCGVVFGSQGQFEGEMTGGGEVSVVF